MVAITELDFQQAKKAIKAMKEYTDREDDNELLGSERGLWIQVKLAKMTRGTSSHHRTLAIPHSILPENADICLITRDQPKVYQEKINGLSLDTKITVYSGKTFREKYSTMEARRQAARKYDVFLVDVSLATKINSMFGSSFNRANKKPMLIKVSEDEQMLDIEKIKENINQAINTISIADSPSDLKKAKFGKVDMSEKALVDNFKVVFNDIKEHVEWKFVQSVSIQADQSVTLPIYACIPGVWLLDEKTAPVEEEKPTKKQRVAKKEEPTKKAATAPKKEEPTKEQEQSLKKAAKKTSTGKKPAAKKANQEPAKVQTEKKIIKPAAKSTRKTRSKN